MEFKKSNMTVNGNSVHVSMPFAKVDENKRLVSGFATLDNVDTQDDVVMADASLKAFTRARGNIREMHQPLAVGKMVDFREDEYFDPKADNGQGKLYRGIFVTAYVSEGAEDTWKKVLDGTLTGFSIGGEINEASNEFVKEAGRTVRFIKDYDLVELSLVDNPANQLANVFSIQKSANGSLTVEGMVTEVTLENVFYCKSDDTVIVNDAERHDCPICGNKMEIAGWFETGPDRAEKVRSILAKFQNPAEKEAAPISESEGGVDMDTETVNKSGEENVEVQPEVEAEETAETPEEVVEDKNVEPEAETAESPEEIQDEETEISKKISELHDAVKTGLEKNHQETLSKVSELETTIANAKDEFLTRAEELSNKIDGLGSNLETQKTRLAELEKTLEKFNSSDAMKKSADYNNTAENNVQKETFWGNTFSGR